MRRLVLLLCLSACATPKHENRVSIDPEFVSLVQEFKTHGGVEIVDLVVEFGEPASLGCTHSDSTALVGCCRYRDGHTPTIAIDKDKWSALDVQDLHLGQEYLGTSKRLLLFHELGHCVLKRSHLETIHARGIPASIMMGQTTSGYLPQLFYDYNAEYIEELFGRGIGPTPFGQ